MTDAELLIAEEEARHREAHSVDADRLGAIHRRAAAEADEAEAEQPEQPEPGPPLGDEADTEATGEPAMIVCPFCGVGEVDANEALEHLARVTAIVRPFKSSRWHATCPDCDGFGTVFTGSALPEQSITPCETCAGAGYVAASLLTNAPAEREPEREPTLPEPEGWRDPMRWPPGEGGEPPAVGMDWDPQKGRWGYPERP